MSHTRRVTIRGVLVAILALASLSILRMDGDADAGSPEPSPNPSEAPSTSTFSVLSVGGEGLPRGKVGDIVRLPPGVDTEEETLAYLQSLANPPASPTPSPSIWSASNPKAPDLSVIASLESRGIDPEEFAREYFKGKESAEELIERLATK
jgi:hypothetical protein